MTRLSSLAKKQIVAASGLLLIGFLVFHLSANLLIFYGPEAYNSFPEFIHSTGILMRLLEFGLAGIFLLHIYFTACIVIENRRARKSRYHLKVSENGKSLLARLMPLTGIIILVYLGVHIWDYTLQDHYAATSIVHGQQLGLYGLVYNSFLNPVRFVFYIIAMCAVGFHLGHAVQSVCQTFGVLDAKRMSLVNRVSLAIAILFSVGFSSIPIYVMVLECCFT